MITVPPNNRSAHTQLVLRVSGHILLHIKSENEVGVMAWITKNTTIPILEIVAYDSSDLNPMSHEYKLLSGVHGSTLSEIYRGLNQPQINHIIGQLIDRMMKRLLSVRLRMRLFGSFLTWRTEDSVIIWHRVRRLSISARQEAVQIPAPTPASC